MARLIQKFLIRSRRNGWSLPVLALALAGLVAASAGISGAEGVMFTLALGCAFLLGTASRPGPFHLRSLATQSLDRPVDREILLARMQDCTDTPEAAGQSVCIVLALDGFGELGDRLGQRGLADLVHQMGERLYGEIRSNDTLADLGDGRFAVFLPPNARIDLETSVQTAMRLNAACARPVSVDGLRLHLTGCAGFCTSSRAPTGNGVEGYLTAALTALAAAQREGPRSLRAYDHTLAPAPGSAPVEDGDLDVAAALRKGDIEPWYQPQICADTGALTGIEALARWQHPDHGTLSPGRFLPAIRAQGLAQRLTDAMLGKALSQLCTWDRAGIAIPRVSINLGPEDLADPGLADRVAWALDRHNLPPARLGVEVLESVIAKADPDDMAARNILALGRLGCLIDLDDFGTGSASINGIRRFSVDRIKIDRSLITAIDTDPDQHAMVAAILTMAAQLGVEVLGEGVETPGEHSALAQLGCGHVQGFAIARPMPAHDLVAWTLRRADVPPLTPDAPSAKATRDTVQRGFDGKTA